MSIPIVDTHLHLWDLDVPGLDYEWLEVDPDPFLGPLAEIKRSPWTAARFRRDSRHVDLLAAVHVQAASGPGDPLTETEWLVGQHREVGLPQAIIGRADLLADDFEEVVDRQLAATPLFRGVRDMTMPGKFADPRLDLALAVLESRGLSWDLHCFHEEMPLVREVAERHPALPIALGHAGFPLDRDDAYKAAWEEGITALAGAENVVCKFSGLGMGDHGWTVESWRPWVRHALAAFGPGRCMFGSNWPVESLYGSFDAIVAAYEDLTADLGADDRHGFFVGNAVRHYRLDTKETP
ncbi:MAG: amidohydrolase family protein [Actinobacteria bacterium]|nr:amidohydrolase family protein [Actinomycetota bacterium]